MKTLHTIRQLATTVCSILLLSACNNGEEENLATRQVPLELNIKEAATRSVITGTTLPQDSYFGIFGVADTTLEEDMDNISVWYYERCELQETVYLDGTPTVIYAYYPYNENTDLNHMSLSANAQTDYLYGYSVNDNDFISTVNADNPRANILMKHAMSRITLRIKVSELQSDIQDLYGIKLVNAYLAGELDIPSGKLALSDKGELSIPTKERLSTTAHSFDILAFPETTVQDITLSLNLNEVYYSVPMPAGGWKSGQQYTYEVTIDKGTLSVTQATITPWNNNAQDGIEVGDDNYVEN